MSHALGLCAALWLHHGYITVTSRLHHGHSTVTLRLHHGYITVTSEVKKRQIGVAANAMAPPVSKPASVPQ